jgi:hypothetical protein
MEGTVFFLDPYQVFFIEPFQANLYNVLRNSLTVLRIKTITLINCPVPCGGIMYLCDTLYRFTVCPLPFLAVLLRKNDTVGLTSYPSA